MMDMPEWESIDPGEACVFYGWLLDVERVRMRWGCWCWWILRDAWLTQCYPHPKQ